jgi:signal transduction histidine kinase
MTASPGSRQRVRPQVFAAFGIAVTIVLLGGCLSVLWQRHLWLNEKLTARLASVHQLFQAETDREAELIETLTDFLEKDADICAAWLARDRERLLASALPHFEEIRAKYHITHLYFLDTDQICFLRVHKPSKHGDPIERYSLTKAAKTGQTVHGLELGPYGTFTLRVVRPWHIDGQLVGYLELGEEIRQVATSLRKILDAELFFAIDKSHLIRSQWEEGLKITGQTGHWDLADNFVFIDRTLEEVPEEILTHLKVIHALHANQNFTFSWRSRSYRCGIIQLKEAGGRDVGDIFALIDTTRGVSTLNKLLAVQIASGIVVSAVLSMLFWRYLGRVEDQLVQAREELEIALQREHSFADDLAHELRTPLAGIRSTIDVALTVDREPHAFRESLGDCSGIVDRMQALVDKLLMLARLDGKRLTFSAEQINLSALIDACWKQFQQRAAAQRLAFENQVPDDIDCVSDRDSLMIIFSNLLENSVNYANVGGRIWVTATRGSKGSIHMVVGNTGCQLDYVQARMAFKQFWRADDSRQSEGRHTGLGLALVRRLTTALGGKTSADVDDHGVFTVYVSLDVPSRP